MGTPYQVLECYRQFVLRVDAAAAGIASRWRGEIQCRPGCDGCCTPLSILPIEAAAMREGITALEALPDAAGRCLMLTAEGLCAVYEYRPLICRTHGLPIAGVEIAGGVDCCPLNFRNHALNRLPRQELIDVDALNRALIAFNALYLRASGLDPRSTERIDLASLRSRAWSDRTPRGVE